MFWRFCPLSLRCDSNRTDLFCCSGLRSLESCLCPYIWRESSRLSCPLREGMYMFRVARVSLPYLLLYSPLSRSGCSCPWSCFFLALRYENYHVILCFDCAICYLPVEQRMVHLQKLWKNDHQTRMIHRPVQPGSQGFCFPPWGSLMFLISKASVSSTESTMFVGFYFICGRKRIKNDFRINTQGTWTQNLSILQKCVDLSWCLHKTVFSLINENINVARSMCLEKLLSTNHQVHVDQ